MITSALQHTRKAIKFFGHQSSINWHKRVALHGRRAALNLGHSDVAFENVTEFQKAEILPHFRNLLSGKESLILDLGCGPGRFSGSLADLTEARVLAVDPIEEFLTMAPPHPSVNYQPMRAGKIPAPTQAVDAVWICLVLGGLRGHVLKHTLSEVNRVLKKDGLVFLVENTSDTSSPSHYQFRSFSSYQAMLPFVQLHCLSSYQDLGETISIMAGRKQMLSEPEPSRQIHWWYPHVQAATR